MLLLNPEVFIKDFKISGQWISAITSHQTMRQPKKNHLPTELAEKTFQNSPHNAIFRFFYMGYWPILRSRWLDVGRALFLRVFGARRSRGPETRKKRTRPISSHLHRTNLVNKGFIIWLSGKFFLYDAASSPERARWPITAQNLIILPTDGTRHINKAVIPLALVRYELILPFSPCLR